MNCTSSCPLEKKRLCNIRTPLSHQGKEMIYNISATSLLSKYYLYLSIFPQERGWIKSFSVRPMPLKSFR